MCKWQHLPPAAQEVLLDATHPDLQANFELILLSRAREVRSEPRQANAHASGNANGNARGFQNLSVFQSGQARPTVPWVT